MYQKIRPDVTVQHVGDESLVLDQGSGQIHQLNEAAARILARCDGQHSIDSINQDYAAYFSLDPETAERDVSATIKQLKQLNVITSE